ncbi:MarR family transcriptional regulator [Candidatus Saccharibacteria bacterium]|nr:MarR family transcriptional regulator [Candidatus Saccharibacteria bacterium]
MQADENPLRLKKQLCFPIYLCSKEIIRRYAPLLKELDLTHTQYIVMMYFWEKKQSNVRDLGRALLLDPSTLTPLLRRLEAKGYITRVESKLDRRNLDIAITDKGARLEEKALSVPEVMQRCIDLPEDEAKVLYNLVNKALNNIKRNEIQ